MSRTAIKPATGNSREEFLAACRRADKYKIQSRTQQPFCVIEDIFGLTAVDEKTMVHRTLNHGAKLVYSTEGK